jgi:hypothetical protein
MKKTISNLFLILCFAATIALEGCEKEEAGISTQDSNDVADEAIIEAYFQDMDDLGGVAISAPTSAEYNGGRTSGTITVTDNRFLCEGISVLLEILEGSTTQHPKGRITVDFGTGGCADLKGNVRKGKLIFTYDGPRLTEGTSLITTTDNYSINGVKLEGTRTTTVIHVASLTDVEYHVVLENGKATFEDQTTATRESDLYLRVVLGSTAAEDKLIVGIDSEASGTTRASRAYLVTLSKKLEYHRFCGLAVSGIKNFVIDGAQNIKVDYGTGDCDNTFTISMLGISRTITIAG